MKKTTVLLLVFIVSTSILFAQPCSDLFISEYLEGTYNNKAIEIYNPTNKTINLNGYILVRYSNGETTPNPVALSGTIASKDVIVVVLDKRNCTATGQDTCVFEELRNKADLFLCPVYEQNKMMYFNGNDAITLEKNDGTILDIIGKVGENPAVGNADGSQGGWNNVDSLHYISGKYWWTPWTKDHTLIRKRDVREGMHQNPDYYNTGLQWDSLPKNTFNELGRHVCDCQVTYIPAEKKINTAFFFPNPATGGKFTVKSNTIIAGIEVVNILGQTIYRQNNVARRGDMIIQIDNYQKGIYLIKITFDDKSSVIKKIILK